MQCPRFRRRPELWVPAVLVLVWGTACSVESVTPPGSMHGGHASASGDGGAGSGDSGAGGGGSGADAGGAPGPDGGLESCPAGTARIDGGGAPCADIDECAQGLDDCDDEPLATCVNMLFTYRCVCPPGTSDPATAGRNCLGPGSGGTGGGAGTGGSGAGAGGGGGCPMGYVDLNGHGTDCEDIDECARGFASCDPNPAATCVNLAGSYACECPAGYYDPATDGANCIDLPECAMGLDDCDDDPAAICSETTGSYDCACPPGYEDAPASEPGRNCVDIDECSLGTDLCDDDPAATCANTRGGYTCACPFDFQDPSGTGHDCQPIDQCEGSNACDDDPNACVDGLGTYTCECPDGYADVNGNGAQCDDIDECSLGSDLCDDAPVATCANTLGGYTCSCPNGTVDVLGNGHACTPPVDVFALGRNFSCAIQTGGVVKCWGNNAFGQLGIGSTFTRGTQPQTSGPNLSPTDLGGPAIAIAAGSYHVCALLDDGSVKCWGRNDSDVPEEGGGQLGQGHTDDLGDGPGEMGADLPPVALGRPAKAISAGNEFSCAALDDGSVKCWGGNRWGQLGQGHTNAIGDAPGEMTLLTPIELGGVVTAIQCGFRFACARLDGQLKCWGRGEGGRLGQGDDEPRCVDPGDTLPWCPASGVKTVHRGDEPDEMGAFLLPIPLGTGLDVAAFGPGYIHGCAILSNGALKCWGGSEYGIGYGEASVMDPNSVARGDDPNEMGDNLPVIDLPGTALPLQVSAQTYTCVVLSGGALSCFGENTHGQLGLGDTEHRSDTPGEMGDALPLTDLGTGAIVIAVRAGANHACALLATGALKCWGYNQFGQLDYGDTEARGDEPGEMGDALGVSLQLW